MGIFVDHFERGPQPGIIAIRKFQKVGRKIEHCENDFFLCNDGSKCFHLNIAVLSVAGRSCSLGLARDIGCISFEERDCEDDVACYESDSWCHIEQKTIHRQD